MIYIFARLAARHERLREPDQSLGKTRRASGWPGIRSEQIIRWQMYGTRMEERNKTRLVRRQFDASLIVPPPTHHPPRAGRGVNVKSSPYLRAVIVQSWFNHARLQDFCKTATPRRHARQLPGRTGNKKQRQRMRGMTWE
jgi:hypothetical protein